MHSVLTKSRSILVLAGILLLCACTPEKKYRVLSFFFDGVPNPAGESKLSDNSTETEKTIAAEVGEMRRRAQLAKGEADKEVYKSQHPPYVKRKCSSCHDKTSRNMLTASKAKLCFNCHSRSKFKGQYVHGPVAGGACLMCHLPHNSKLSYLLSKSTPALCLQCHEKECFPAREHTDGVTDCLKCHLPHVGEDPMFLR
jgi:predicted CXXCH cytochrome family protein